MRVIKVLSAFCVVILVMGGCDILDPNLPRLIYPEEGEVFTVEAPTFEWSSRNRAVSYKIHVYDFSPDDKTLIETETQDTTFALPQDLFDGAPSGNYFWKVASISEDGDNFWSDLHSFNFDKTIPEINLDTTYFPFGLNYQWIYEHIYTDSDMYSDSIYDTVIISCTSVATDDYYETYILEIGFFDVGEKVVIFGNLVSVFDQSKISLFPQEEYSHLYPFSYDYSKDTLILNSGYSSWVGQYPREGSYHVYRVQGIGVVKEEISEGPVPKAQGPFTYDVYRLLYFIKGADTVWRCEDCP